MRRDKALLFAVILSPLLLFFSCGKDSSNPADTGNGNDGPEGMVLIPAGGSSFQMGSANGSSDEQTVHYVSFTRDFWMDETEVTQSDFEDLMSGYCAGYATPDWHNPYGLGDDYPAYRVSWGDAVLYCNARSRRDGCDTAYTYTSITGTPGNLCELEGISCDFTKDGYRLPTEAEWEFACRAGTITDFYWGKNSDPYPETKTDTTEVSSNAVWYANSWAYDSDDPEYGTHRTATKAANGYLLYDMSGNVYEWCYDWYGAYGSDSLVDPTGPSSGSWHVVRGGSWGNHAFYLRSSNRTFSSPSYEYFFIGFRVVRPDR
ncbi:MAG: formylglycine-generating enzyme family protein [Candidatus Krumholzibacteria bacterium]|nr:formylglycine-generating enzyme family protein [Candidatus Krumholzibacteria bacterium]